MDDTIYRQTTIDAVYERIKQIGFEDNADVLSIRQAVREVPSAQQWIPISEKPKRYGKVLVTFIPSGGTLWTSVIIANYSDLMGIAKPMFWIGEVGKDNFADITEQVTAWMPLPKPYDSNLK